MKNANGSAIGLGQFGIMDVSDDVRILPAGDVLDTIAGVTGRVATTILDPWYNKGVGGIRSDYDDWLSEVIHAAAEISDHVFRVGISGDSRSPTRSAASGLQIGSVADLVL